MDFWVFSGSFREFVASGQANRGLGIYLPYPLATPEGNRFKLEADPILQPIGCLSEHLVLAFQLSSPVSRLRTCSLASAVHRRHVTAVSF